MYICINLYTYIDIYIYIFTFICTYIYIYICIYIHIYIYDCMCIYIYTHTFIYRCMHMYVYLRVYTYIYIYTCACAYRGTCLMDSMLLFSKTPTHLALLGLRCHIEMHSMRKGLIGTIIIFIITIILPRLKWESQM